MRSFPSNLIDLDNSLMGIEIENKNTDIFYDKITISLPIVEKHFFSQTLLLGVLCTLGIISLRKIFHLQSKKSLPNPTSKVVYKHFHIISLM